MDISSIRARRLVALVSIVLFVLSCCLPAIYFFDTVADRVLPGEYATIGAYMLFLSILGPFMANFSGVANLLIWLGWGVLLFNPRRVPTILFALAVAFTLETFQLKYQLIPADEAGVKSMKFDHVAIGYYLWVLSAALPLAACVTWSLQARAKLQTLGTNLVAP